MILMEGMKKVPKHLNLYSTDDNTILSPFFPLCPLAHAYHVACQFVKKIISGCDFVLPIYMDKLVYSSIYCNPEAIREQYILGSDGGATMEST